jgi:hypothetical protein
MTFFKMLVLKKSSEEPPIDPPPSPEVHPIVDKLNQARSAADVVRVMGEWKKDPDAMEKVGNFAELARARQRALSSTGVPEPPKPFVPTPRPAPRPPSNPAPPNPAPPNPAPPAVDDDGPPDYDDPWAGYGNLTDSRPDNPLVATFTPEGFAPEGVTTERPNELITEFIPESDQRRRRRELSPAVRSLLIKPEHRGPDPLFPMMLLGPPVQRVAAALPENQDVEISEEKQALIDKIMGTPKPPQNQNHLSPEQRTAQRINAMIRADFTPAEQMQAQQKLIDLDVPRDDFAKLKTMSMEDLQLMSDMIDHHSAKIDALKKLNIENSDLLDNDQLKQLITEKGRADLFDSDPLNEMFQGKSDLTRAAMIKNEFIKKELERISHYISSSNRENIFGTDDYSEYTKFVEKLHEITQPHQRTNNIKIINQALNAGMPVGYYELNLFREHKGLPPLTREEIDAAMSEERKKEYELPSLLTTGTVDPKQREKLLQQYGYFIDLMNKDKTYDKDARPANLYGMSLIYNIIKRKIYSDPQDERTTPARTTPARTAPARTAPARTAPEADIWIPALEKTIKDPSILMFPNLAAKMQTAIAHAKTGDIKSMMSVYFDAITSGEFLRGNTSKIRERVDKEARGEDSSQLRNQFQSFETFVRLLLRDKFKMELSTPEGIWSPSQRGKPMKYVLTGTEDGKEQQFET